MRPRAWVMLKVIEGSRARVPSLANLLDTQASARTLRTVATSGFGYRSFFRYHHGIRIASASLREADTRCIRIDFHGWAINRLTAPRAGASLLKFRRRTRPGRNLRRSLQFLAQKCERSSDRW